MLYISKKRVKSEDGEIHDSNEDENEKPHPLVSVTKIDPDEIPEVPANKFLYRAGPTNNANQKEFRQHFGRERIRLRRKTGRVFKGRGVFVSICDFYFKSKNTMIHLVSSFLIICFVLLIYELGNMDMRIIRIYDFFFYIYSCT